MKLSKPYRRTVRTPLVPFSSVPSINFPLDDVNFYVLEKSLVAGWTTTQRDMPEESTEKVWALSLQRVKGIQILLGYLERFLHTEGIGIKKLVHLCIYI